MSKYIIELDDRIKLVTSVGVTENGVVYTTSDYVHNLEELNSDYINENFGELQEEAYQRGHDDGYEAGCATAFKPVSDAEYQRGFEDGKKSKEKGCEGCKYEECGDTEDPCWHCRKNYKDKYEPAPPSDRIEVGKGEPCIIDEQTRQAINNAISVLAETMDKIREKLEVFNG